MDRAIAGPAVSDLGFARLVPVRVASDMLVGRCVEVPAVRVPIAEAAGRVAAAKVTALRALPERAIALRDGWAVAASETFGATSYAPCIATTLPRRVTCGDALPETADAVLPLPAVRVDGAIAEIYASATPWEGARAKGGDIAEGAVLVAAGETLRPEHVPLLRLAGVTELDVRMPSLAILSLGSEGAVAAAAYVASLAARGGASVRASSAAVEDLVTTAETADLVLVLGDSGFDGNIVHALRRAGEVLAHGIAVRPGETMGCGVIAHGAKGAGIPVVFASDRLESALAAWLLLARPCLDRLSGREPCERGGALALARKIVSAPGVSDLSVLSRAPADDGTERWEPLATGDIPWNAILRAEAWLLVPPESEGYPAGGKVCAKFL